MLHDARHGDHVVTAHDEWPGFTLRPRDFGIDEHVLNFLLPPREPVAGPPGSYLKPCELGADAPLAPANLAVEWERPVLEPEAVVLAYRLEPAAQIDPLRAHRRAEQLGERRRHGRAGVERAQDVLVGRGMELAEERQDLLADQAALRLAIARIDAEREPFRFAIRNRLLTPHGQERVHDAVVAPWRHAGRAPARGEPVEDRLDLIGGGVPGRAQAIACDGVTLVAQLSLAEPAPIELDDVGAERLAAEACILLGSCAAELVVHVQRRDGIAELAQCVPETRGVRAARDEAADLAARLDQLVPADVRFDPCAEHGGIVAYCDESSAETSQPCAARPAWAPSSSLCDEVASRQAFAMCCVALPPFAVSATAREYSRNIELRR